MSKNNFDSSVFGERRYLKETAVPTIFSFPAHLLKTLKSRPLPKKRTHSPNAEPECRKVQKTTHNDCTQGSINCYSMHAGTPENTTAFNNLPHVTPSQDNLSAEVDRNESSVTNFASVSQEPLHSITSTSNECTENINSLVSQSTHTIGRNICVSEILSPPHITQQCTPSNKHVNSDHDYCLPSPRKMYKHLRACRQKNRILMNKIKVSKVKSKRLTRKLKTLQDAISGLSKYLTKSDSVIINDVFGNVIKELMSAKKPVVYSQEAKKFAITIQFYSNKAYNYLRKYLTLPHPCTIRSWASKLDGGPGFTQQCFEYLASLQEPKKVCLIMDEMAIKHQIDFDGKQSVGYCDLGNGVLEHDDVPEAKEVLVFMIVSINRSWKLPVGYCLVNGVNHSIKVNLITEYIRKLYSVGVICVAVTFDGAPANVTMMKDLGIELDVNYVPKNCYFEHPCDSTLKVRCFLDASHMLKLVRNMLGEHKVLIYDGGKDPKVIDWKYFTMLHDLQLQEGMHAANRFGRKHVEWQRQKMKVKLAAQTFSLSVSSAFKFLEKMLPEFSDVAATAEFCEVINNCFDLLNSCHPLASYSKSPIRKTNKESVCNLISFTITYLKQICDGNYNPVLRGRRRTAIMGFILDLMSVKSIAEEYVWQEDSELKYLLTRKFSQDHLELFFATVRSRGGNNNNPSALQFRSAYRKVLLANISPPSSGNCAADNTNAAMLHGQISDVTKSVVHDPSVIENDHNYHIYISEFKQLSEYSDQIVLYIAGWVARKLQKSLNCQLCMNIVHDVDSQEEDSLTAIKNKGGLVYASADVVNTCLIAEKVLRSSCLLHKLTPQRNVLHELTLKTVNVLVTKKYFKHHEHLFTACEFGEESHYSILVKCIIKLYFRTRLHHVAKLNSTMHQGQSVRQMYTKLILFKGQ